MLEEIAQQPEALARTIAEERGKVARLGRSLCARDLDLIVLVARGSSDNAALFGRYLLEIQTGIPVALAAPSVNTLYGARLRLSRALVIGVSQSGEGEDINRVLEMAREAGARCTVGITNEPDSSMTKFVDETLLTYAARALELRAEVEQLVERYVFMENCVVVGRGLIYANAFEMALKLMETCYVVAERFSSADFLHGPLAMVERHFPIFAFAPPGVTLAGVRELLARLKELRADTLVFTSDAEAASLATRSVLLPPEIGETLAVIPYIIPAQLFAALLADAKGLDPDAPRSLAKVTRTL